jgi:hypothetical protein
VIGRLHAHHCHQGVGGGAAREVAHHMCLVEPVGKTGARLLRVVVMLTTHVLLTSKSLIASRDSDQL